MLVAPTLTVYEVRNATPILTGPGPARLTTLGASTIAGSVGAPGSYRLRIQPTPYLQVRAGDVCVKPAPGGESTLVVLRAAEEVRARGARESPRSDRRVRARELRSHESTLDHLGMARSDAGFASDARCIAYVTDCRIGEATTGFPMSLTRDVTSH